LKALPNDNVIDGEIVAYGADGQPSFNVLQNHRGAGPELHLYAFDLQTLRGKDLMRESLDERREILRAELMPLLPDSIRYSETLEASPAELIDAVREQGFEGIVAKRRGSRKCSGAWQKMRVHQRREFTIGGFTLGGRNFDAILIGDYWIRRADARHGNYDAAGGRGAVGRVSDLLFGTTPKGVTLKLVSSTSAGRWNAQNRAMIHPATVQPKIRFMMKILTKFGWRLSIAAAVGRK
jgi:hypothetical protein